jgi:hypothetical protein
MAAYCGPAVLSLADASDAAAPTSKSNDMPYGFKPVRAQHGEPLTYAIPADDAKDTLASIASMYPNAASAARTCCTTAMTVREEAPCLARCLGAANLGKCRTGMQRCDELARTSAADLRAEGLDTCRQLLATCSVTHGVSALHVDRCSSQCLANKLAEACR